MSILQLIGFPFFVALLPMVLTYLVISEPYRLLATIDEPSDAESTRFVFATVFGLCLGLLFFGRIIPNVVIHYQVGAGIVLWVLQMVWKLLWAPTCQRFDKWVQRKLDRR